MKTASTRSIVFVTLTATTLVLGGCGLSRAVKGGAIGAATGGAIGAAIGNRMGSTATGAIAGAAIGGTAGAVIGHYMDRQAEEMAANLDSASVERVGEGIKLTFGSGILFRSGSADLTPEASTNLVQLADILKKYPDTNLIIEGHTDSDGSESFNQTLSERRANTVRTALVNNGVAAERLTAVGYGESQPVMSNDTPAGKAANRRVEIAVFANDKLKQEAQASAAQ